MLLIKRKNNLFGSMILFLAAFIWGFAFIPQSLATDTINSLAFNCLRFVQATGVLLIIYLAYYFISKKMGKTLAKWNLDTLIGGSLAGLSLFIATNLQQYGLAQTTVGKASFITAMYIVFVPLLGLLTGKKPSTACWYAIPIAVIGFFLLSIDGNMSLGIGDAMILLCALLLAMQICFIDVYCETTDPIKFTLVQFFVCALLGIPAMAIAGFPTTTQIHDSMWSLLYLGILSAGIGFTLQTVGQKHTEPALGTLIMSLESVIGFLCGALILKEEHTLKQTIGCVLVFIAVFLAQIVAPRDMLNFDKAAFALTERKNK